MQPGQQGQQFDDKQKTNKETKYFTYTRWLIAVVALLLIAGGTIFWLVGPQNSVNAILPVIIFTVLGVVIALFQWLFPVSSSSSETPPTVPQIIVHAPPTQSISSFSSSSVNVHSNTAEKPLSEDSKVNQQIKKPDSYKEAPGLETITDSIFRFNEPLTDPREFFGRARERATLIDRTRKAASTSIVGPRRIGKTWLISYLRLVAEAELGLRFRIGYLDATMPSCATVAGFTAKAIEQLGILRPVSRQTNAGLAVLEEVVRDFQLRNEIPILCIDEFESLGNRQGFDLNFYTGLRALTQTGLGLIVISKRSLVDIVGEDSKTSGFFNVFEQLTLKPFGNQEAEKFILAKGGQAGFTDQESLYMLKYGQVAKQQWPPLRLQLVGKLLLEDKVLASNEDPYYYQPDDPEYWRTFEERLEEIYRGVGLA